MTTYRHDTPVPPGVPPLLWVVAVLAADAALDAYDRDNALGVRGDGDA